MIFKYIMTGILLLISSIGIWRIIGTKNFYTTYASTNNHTMISSVILDNFWQIYIPLHRTRVYHEKNHQTFEPRPLHLLPLATTMSETYEVVEKRINEAIAAINLSSKASRNNIAQEFMVSVEILRSHPNDNPLASDLIRIKSKGACTRSGDELYMTFWPGGNLPASGIQGLHQKKIAPDQEKALHDDFILLERMMYDRLLTWNDWKCRNLRLQMSSDRNKPLSFVGSQWAKSWLYRHFHEIATFLVVDGGISMIDTEIIV